MLDLQIQHHFGNHVYAKQMNLPADHGAQTHKHAFDHLSILAMSDARVEGDGVQSAVAAGNCIIIKANAVHTITALTDSVWFCIHATDVTDLDSHKWTLPTHTNLSRTTSCKIGTAHQSAHRLPNNGLTLCGRVPLSSNWLAVAATRYRVFSIPPGCNYGQSIARQPWSRRSAHDFPIFRFNVQRFIFARKYYTAIAIGLLFLLSESDQRALISRVAAILVPQGRFLFTAPVQTGSWKDLSTGLECLSLGQDRYAELLRSAGFHVVATYSDEGNNNYYDAEKS